MKDKYLDIEEEVLSLVGQIEYGDITDLAIYWKSLRDALIKLNICEGTLKPTSVSNVLKSFPSVLKGSSLIALTEELEELTDSSSSDTLPEDELADLKESAKDFEDQFLDFIKRISENDN
jgi:hypothetical protein